ncbi:MAG: flavin reductase [Lachnospiraceae bacterium]|nr:flavin reductase [Lachnospiraceae bacterium]
MDKKVMEKLSYGLFVCTAKEGNKDNGCIINTAIQVTNTPNRVAVAINKSNFTHDMVVKTKVMNVCVISKKADFDMFKHFGFQSGKDVDKFNVASSQWMKENINNCKRAENGLMYIAAGTNSYISLAVQDMIDLDSHTLFICAVTDGAIIDDSPSATYQFYHQNIKTQAEKIGTTPEGKTIWKCKICGYVYEGEDLPEDFICPWCKHPASDFEKVSVTA